MSNPPLLDVLVRPAQPSEVSALEHLFQLYSYDFSEIVGLELGDDGRFEGRTFAPYWTDAWRHPRLILVGGRLAGFALVHQGSRLSGDATIWDMAEFFVVRRHRRAGVGAAAATHLFRAFPGRWEVRQTPRNTAATAFWRRVINQYSGGEFHEALHDDDRWRGPVQSFTSEMP